METSSREFKEKIDMSFMNWPLIYFSSCLVFFHLIWFVSVGAQCTRDIGTP